MTMASPPSSSSPATCSAYDVMCDMFLVRHIASFQRGFPRDIVEWKRANESRRSPWGNSQQSRGLLPNLVVQTNNLRILERLHRYYKAHPAYYDKVPQMSFNHIWAVALKCGHVEMAEWIVSNEPTLSHGDNESKAEGTIRSAITSPGVDMTKWVLAHRPRYKQLGQLFDMNKWLVDNVNGITASRWEMDLAAKGGHLDMVRYLHEHSKGGCSSKAMDNGAYYGHLEVVKFLHEHRTEGCTTEAMDPAAYQGHMEIVRFLHEHRTEGCTTNAMDNAARNGHLEIVRFLHENRTEGATLNAMTDAVSNRHFEIVQFLQQNRTEGCSGEVIVFATENRDLEMVRFLHEHYPEHSMSRSLSMATDVGQLDIVQYIVENTTQGCVFNCLQKAKKLGFSEIEEYLITIVDPSIQSCKYTSHKKEDTKRMCQKQK